MICEPTEIEQSLNTSDGYMPNLHCSKSDLSMAKTVHILIFEIWNF